MPKTSSSFRPRTRTTSRIAPMVLTGLSTAALFYFLDPRSGARRRAIWRDKSYSVLRKTLRFIASASTDLRHKASGVRARMLSTALPNEADAPTLEARVRARLGRLSSHPRAIEVLVENEGAVRLRGDILERELQVVLEGVAAVRGVDNVVNELRSYAEAGNLPSLQGEGRRGDELGVLQREWTPAARLLAGTAGLTLLAYGLSRRSTPSLLGAVGGAALLARCISNASLSGQLGLGESAAGVQVQKSLLVYAEPDEVYAIWRDPQNFPRFMNNVKAVRKLSDKVYHWKVAGPAGVSVEWQAEVTADIPGRTLAWRTVPDAPIRSAGVVQFEPAENGGGTLLHVRMFYYPPANALGHALAKIFGVDPRRQMDEDLVRFKTMIEASKAGQGPAAEPVVVRH